MSTRKEIYDQIDTILPFDVFCRTYFWHPVGSTLRLSNEGLIFLRNIIPEQCHEVEVIEKLDKKKMPAKHLIFMSRYCTMPYYIGMDRIYFFDEDEAFIFKLCDGDIENVKEISAKPEKRC